MKILIGAMIVGLLLCGELQARELAIIANKSYPFNQITVEALKEIYKGEKTVVGGTRIHPLDQKEPVIKKVFLNEIVGKSIDQYNVYWIKRVFQEGGVPPEIKSGSDDVLDTITHGTGAVGYVWKSEAAGREDIKILLTIEVNH